MAESNNRQLPNEIAPVEAATPSSVVLAVPADDPAQLERDLHAFLDLPLSIAGKGVDSPPSSEHPGNGLRGTVSTKRRTLAERLSSVIGKAEGLPTDLADQHDHYLHGQPKR